MRSGDSAPSSLLGHPPMPGYAGAVELVRQLRVTADRMRPGPTGLDRLLREKATRTTLHTAEAGANLPTQRRTLFYRSALYGTYDCTGILRTARRLRLLPVDAALADDAVIRRAQQDVTLAMGAMLARRRRG